MNYNLFKTTSSISNGLSGLVSFDLRTAPNQTLSLHKAYLLARFQVSIGADNSGFGAYVTDGGGAAPHVSDTIISLCSNAGACLFDTARVSINGVQLPSVEQYSLSSTVSRIVHTTSREQTDVELGSRIYLHDTNYVPPGDSADQRETILSPAQTYKYSGLRKMLAKSASALAPLRRVSATNYTNGVLEFEIPIALDAPCFNTPNHLPGGCNLKLDLTVNSQYHVSTVQFSGSGSPANAVAAPTISKDSGAAAANQIKIFCNDLSLYAPSTYDDARVSASVLMSPRLLHTHIKTLNSVNESFVATLPFLADRLFISFADTRRGTPGKPYGYIGANYDSPVATGPEVFSATSPHRLVRSVEVLSNAASYPMSRYSIDMSGATSTVETHRSYIDFIKLSGCRLMTFSEWRENPIWAVLLEVPATELTMSVQFSAAPSNAQCNVLAISDRSLVTIQYDAHGVAMATDFSRE
jgi:hypothetical protein